MLIHIPGIQIKVFKGLKPKLFRSISLSRFLNNTGIYIHNIYTRIIKRKCLNLKNQSHLFLVQFGFLKNKSICFGISFGYKKLNPVDDTDIDLSAAFCFLFRQKSSRAYFRTLYDWHTLFPTQEFNPENSNYISCYLVSFNYDSLHCLSLA